MTSYNPITARVIQTRDTNENIILSAAGRRENAQFMQYVRQNDAILLITTPSCPPAENDELVVFALMVLEWAIKPILSVRRIYVRVRRKQRSFAKGFGLKYFNLVSRGFLVYTDGPFFACARKSVVQPHRKITIPRGQTSWEYDAVAERRRPARFTTSCPPDKSRPFVTAYPPASPGE